MGGWNPDVSAFQSQDFRVAVPEAWRYRSVTTLLEPPGGAFQRSVVITQDLAPPASTAEAYAADQQRELAQILPGFAVEEEATVALAGALVPQLTYSWSPPTSPPITQRQVFLVKAPWVFTITATALKGELAALDATFAGVLQSFSV